jgi:hypothetical protein
VEVRHLGGCHSQIFEVFIVHTSEVCPFIKHTRTIFPHNLFQVKEKL